VFLFFQLLNELSEFLETLVWTLLCWSPVGHNAFAETELYHVWQYGTTRLSLDGSHLCEISYCRIFAKIQGGSNMTGTDMYVNKLHCAAAVRP